MATQQQIGSLQVDQDLTYQKRTWTAERIGWGLMLLLVLAGASGLFGGGPLSQATAGQQGDALWVEHPRFARLKAPTELRLHLGAESVSGDTVRVWLDQRYLDSARVDQVSPEPDQVVVGADRLEYVFATASGQPLTLTFFLEPEHVGRHVGRIGIEDGPTVEFSQIIWP